MINKQTCSELPTLPTLFMTEATAMGRDAIPDQFCSFFKQRSEKLVADGIPYHDNDDGSDVVLGSRKMALIMIMTVR